MSKSSVKGQVESFLAVAGAGLAVVYALGFLILSLYDAKFGIIEFDPLRARILHVGFLFVCLLALPVAAMNYGFSHYVGLSAIMEPGEPRLESRRKVILLCAFIYTSWLMAAYLGIFLIPEAPPILPSWLYATAPLAAIGFFSVSFSAIDKRFSAIPNRCVVLAILSALFVGLVLDAFGTRSVGPLSAWFFGVGVLSFLARDTKDLVREVFHWVNWCFVLALLGLYATSVYAGIEPKYGGGAPIPVVFYLDRPLPWEASKVVSTSLLDETSRGYFVVAPGGRNALFIPRSDVSAIYFGPLGKAPKVK